ncbi:apolipoprotein N-acyltransferase [Corallococcus praedator]|uniref:Apolipoprotein N-acyltransferase n=1 Tax=Corallococcus praedator TaxID=2316724 RepID=A0ABX9Q673_9BACT|nr:MULTISPECIES: apolipoprotein N-acyltransferase [Corallococcus]RKH18666.1 apolipoprotein N-acyltransferase [Corallococcus sp. CA031C]RKH91763.1 apolipoprotein N-acyltransferase [Corallococcus praedator]
MTAWRGWAGALLGVAATTGLFALFGELRPGFVWLGAVAMAPWLAAVDRAPSARRALALGTLLSVTFTALVFGWFPGAIAAYSHAPAWLCWGVFLLIAPVLELQFLTASWIRWYARRKVGTDSRLGWVPPLLTALVYVGTEWFTPKLFAETLGHGLYASEVLRQGADVAGAPGLTLGLLLVNECFVAVGQGLAARRGLKPVPLVLALVLAVVGFGYGAVRLGQVRSAVRSAPALTVGAVQANITNIEKRAAEEGTYEVVRDILDTHYAMSDALLRSGPLDLLVWPETVYPTTFGTPKSEDGGALDEEIRAWVAERGVPLVFGTYDLDGEREFNAAMFLGPSATGELAQAAYRKTMLFPLTEWVPDALDSPTLRAWMPWTGRWKRGPGPRMVDFRLNGGRVLKVAPLICYEALFPSYVAEEVRQGAELLLTLSNDSWFSGTPAPRLHLMHAAFRSIETRTAQVRVTNSGVSAFIDPAGTWTSEMEDNQRSSVVMRVPAAERLHSLAGAWGDWLGPVALALSVGLGVWLRRRSVSARAASA